MPLHEDQLAANRATLRTYNTGVKLGINDTLMASAPVVDVATLKTAILALNVHEDQRYPLVRINKALEVAEDIFTLTTANVNAATTVVLMQTNWVTAAAAAGDTILDPTMYGNIFWGE